MKFTFAAALSFFFALAGATPVQAQEPYPKNVVRIIIPFAPGGSTDLLGRSVAERLTDLWKQPVIVENKAGASGTIGAEMVARSKADGYTLLLGTAQTHGVAQTLYPKLPYDTLRDFAPITELVDIPQLLSVRPSLPIHSVKEFVEYGKAHPGQLTHGNGNGSAAHMAMELFATRAGIRTLHVPYKGSGPTMVDLLAGTLDVGFDVIMTTLPYMQSGRLRTIAVTSRKRSPLAPQVPTIAESGYPGFEASVWFGLFAPAGTPASVVNKISEDCKRVLTEPKMREKLEAAGFEIVASNPGEFRIRVKDEVQRWRKVILENKIRPE